MFETLLIVPANQNPYALLWVFQSLFSTFTKSADPLGVSWNCRRKKLAMPTTKSCSSASPFNLMLEFWPTHLQTNRELLTKLLEQGCVGCSVTDTCVSGLFWGSKFSGQNCLAEKLPRILLWIQNRLLSSLLHRSVISTLQLGFRIVANVQPLSKRISLNGMMCASLKKIVCVFCCRSKSCFAVWAKIVKSCILLLPSCSSSCMQVQMKWWFDHVFVVLAIFGRWEAVCKPGGLLESCTCRRRWRQPLPERAAFALTKRT